MTTVAKLVYICDWLPPDFGAVGQYSLKFARKYARENGWDVVLLGLSSAGNSRTQEAQDPGRLTMFAVGSNRYEGSRWLERLWWTLRSDLKLIAAGWRHLWTCDRIIFTESPPFLLQFLVPLNLLLRKQLVYRGTDLYPECIMAALDAQPWLLRLFYRWTCFLRRHVDQIEVLGHDQAKRLRAGGVPPARILLKRDQSPVPISGSEERLAPPAAIANYTILLYSGNYGVPHEVDTFLEGYVAHHRSGSARIALWLNAFGCGADRVEQVCRDLGLPVARTRPVPLAVLPRLLVTPAAHLITLRRAFTGLVMPSKVYGCIASGRSILYIGDVESDVHYLCERAKLPIYRQVDPGDPNGVARALEEIAETVPAFAATALVAANPKAGGAMMQPRSRTATNNLPGVPAVEVVPELQQPLEDLARAAGQSPARIVNLALTEYLERRLRPDRETSGSTSSYVEMTAREGLQEIL